MLFDAISPAEVLRFIQDYWIVPAGIVALYFYGQFHFNTPEYTIDLGDHASHTAAPILRIVAQAPPIFTTSRARYNRYARRYILILEIAFLVLVFCSGLVADFVRVASGTPGHEQLEILNQLKGEPLQYKALWTLFFLTGLLSSIPGFKDVDRWLLEKLHGAAFIPAEVRRLTSALYDGSYQPPAQTLQAIRPTLSMRDTIRVADKLAAGSLERRLIELLCLRQQLQRSTENPRYIAFRSKLERDVRQLVDQTEGIRGEAAGYLRDQQNLIPDSVTDIDLYIDQNLSTPKIAALSARRQSLADKSNALFETACLLSALSVYSTENTPEAINEALKDLGFNVQVPHLPILDWDAVVRVTLSVFALMLATNGISSLFMAQLHVNLHNLQLDRDRMARLALIFTILYAVVMIMGIKLKRRWRRDAKERPENLLVAAASFCVSLAVTIPFSWIFRKELTLAPFLFALAPAVLGYFVGRYVDRRLRGDPLSLAEAAWQGSLQMAASLLAMWLYPVPGIELTTHQSIYFYAFAAVETLVFGFLVGVLFQFFYRQTKSAGDIGTEPAGIIRMGERGDSRLLQLPATAA